MRGFADVEHSPVPDLAHDLIGHLPMLVDEQHRGFLRRMGEALCRAEPDARDHRLYEAQQRAGYLRQGSVRHPSVIRKADAEVANAEAELERQPSLLARLGRLYLWTIEFGLLGDAGNWGAYGAALMSSARELDHLMSGGAQVLPLSVEAMAKGITFCNPQRTYFFALDHAVVHQILDDILYLGERTGYSQTYPRHSHVVTRPRT
jgi:phenylalanine-4-hydroxylase